VPELPEVETIVRGLASNVVGKQIDAVEVRLPKIAVSAKKRAFQRELPGERIVGVSRRGKYAVLELSWGRRLVTSLRMTGRLVVQRPGEDDFPGTHVVLHMTDGTRLSFADVRTFGRMRLVEPGEAWDRDLGVEPLSADFTAEALAGMLSGRTTPVKVFLLDQRRIAGIGNIYAAEALWQAGIRPSRPAKTLTKPRIARLHTAIVEVLDRAVRMRGSSIDDYVDAAGLRGGFQNVLSVYGRLGEPCERCGKPVVRTVLGQRGTWWCRSCQR
jgi:formamidopyrimidine-DNA glycosylase